MIFFFKLSIRAANLDTNDIKFDELEDLFENASPTKTAATQEVL